MIIDFHTHTHHSYDSMMHPAKILKIARSRGLDGIVICDHNTIKGGLEAYELNKGNDDFTVIVAAEIETSIGDVTGLFLKEEIKSREFSEVVDEIKAQGGKVILNHPYKGHDLAGLDYSKIDFIEGYNGRLGTHDNERACELAEKHGIPIISGSDAHVYAEIANCRTKVEDISSLKPVSCEYKRSKQINITKSQYVKALKRKSFKVLYSASAIQLKYWYRSLFKTSE